MTLSKAMRIAKDFYDEDTYEHALRVAKYVSSMPIALRSEKDECVVLAILHDIIEDTTFSIDLIEDKDEDFKKALMLLTKDRLTPYVEYCKKIKEESYTYPGVLAYWVKLADMKDHLSLKETLTDRLKEKYLAGLAELL